MSNSKHDNNLQSKKEQASLFEKKEDVLNKPWRKQDWLIWPNTTFSKIKWADCNDTVEGICYRNHTIEECMERCPADVCGTGLYTKFKNGESICTPLRTGIYPNLNPLYRLKNQSLYDLDPNVVNMSVFVNTKIYPFPPSNGNIVFFTDIVSLQDADGDRMLDTSSPIKYGPGPCTLKKDATSVLTLQPVFRTANATTVHNRPIVYGDEFILAVSGTSYVMEVKTAGINPLVWKRALGVLGGSGIAFRLVPTDHNKKEGDLVTYSDTFSLMYADIGMVAVRPDDNQLYLSDSPLLADPTNIESLGIPHSSAQSLTSRFKFKSLMKGYYCENKTCKTVPADDIIPVSYPGKWSRAPRPDILTSGTYKGNNVFNREGCWGLCDSIEQGEGTETSIKLAGGKHLSKLATSPPPLLWEEKRKKTSIFVVIITIVTIVIIIAGVLIYKHFTRSQRLKSL